MNLTLLIGLLGLPLIGNVASALVWRATRLSLISWAPQGLATGLALAIAWMLRGQTFEFALAGWMPVSLTASPIILANNPSSMALLVAWLSVAFYDAYVQRGNKPTWLLLDGLITGGIHAAMVMAALSNNLITLLIGLGLVDLLCGLRLLQIRRIGKYANTDLLFMGMSLALLTVAVALHAAQDNSLYFPLAQLDAQTSGLLAIGLAMRLWLLPVHVPQMDMARTALPHWVAHGCATLLALVHLSTIGFSGLPQWLMMLLLLSAALGLASGMVTQTTERAQQALVLGSFHLVGVGVLLNRPEVTAAGGVAWLLGNLMVNHRPTANLNIAIRFGQLMRLLGVIVLAALPMTVGFVARSGLAEQLMRSPGGLILTILFLLAQLLVVAVALRIALNIPLDELIGDAAPNNSLGGLIPGLVAFLVVIAPIALFGLAPAWLGGSALNAVLGQAGPLTWATFALAVVLGIAVWWTEVRWSPLLESRLGQIEGALSLDWLREILAGAFERLARPLRLVFPFLESDGAMLWAIIVLLLVVAVSRGNP